MPPGQSSTSRIETIGAAELIASHSPEWHERRRSCIGASDAYPILSGDALRIYYEKTRPYDPATEKPPNVHQVRGRLMEPVIGRLWAARTGRRIRRHRHRRKPGDEWLGCNLDYQVLADGDQPTESLEVKAPMSFVYDSIVHGGFRESTAVQKMVQLAVTDYAQGHYVAGNLDRDDVPPIVTFSVLHDGPYLTMLVDLLRRFWHDHVLAMVPPDDDEWNVLGKELVESVPDLTIKQRVLEDVELALEAELYVKARSNRTKSEKMQKEHGALLKGHMQELELEEVTTGGGRFKLTHRAPKPKEKFDPSTLCFHRPIDRDAFVRWCRLMIEEGHMVLQGGDLDVIADNLALDLSIFTSQEEQNKRLNVYELKGDE